MTTQSRCASLIHPDAVAPPSFAGWRTRWCVPDVAADFAHGEAIVVEEPDPSSEAIIDNKKDRHDGFALIDDRPEADTNNGRATWRHIVFDQPYNTHSGAGLRIRDWDDPHLEETLEAARRRTIAPDGGGVSSPTTAGNRRDND